MVTWIHLDRPGWPAACIGDMQDIVRAVRARGASLNATEQPIDTGTAAAGKSTCRVCSRNSR
jgi:hypothetical protein